MDWASVVAAVTGGAIGLSGELLGRRGAQRQARESRQSQREDAERDRQQALEVELQRIAHQRAREAAGAILTAFRSNPIRLSVPAVQETHDSVREIVLAIFTEYLYVQDAMMRQRLIEIEHWVDIANAANGFGPLTLPEIVYEARLEAVRLLGAWLRGESPPITPTEGWQRVQREAPEAIEAYRLKLRDQGINTTVPLIPPDL